MRRWFYTEGLGLQSSSSMAMNMGRWGHVGFEALFVYYMMTDMPVPAKWDTECPLCTVMRDVDDAPLVGRMYPGPPPNRVVPEYEETNCPVCAGTGLGIVALAQSEAEADLMGTDDEIEIPKCETRLHRMLTGYIEKYGAFPFKQWRVVDVEVAVAAPVISPRSGKVYRSRVPVTQTEDGWRIARNDDPFELVSMPWYQIGRLDAVLQHRESGDLLVHEFKTSGNPLQFTRDLHLDTQIPGYTRLLMRLATLDGGMRYSLNRDDDGKIIPARVQGYQYDVVGSAWYSEPYRLKSG